MSLAHLFSAKQVLRRHLARSTRRTAPRRERRPPVLEPLEPRLLLAADSTLLAPLAFDISPAPTPVLVTTPDAPPAPANASAEPVNVDALVQVRLGGYVLNRSTNTFDIRAAIINTSQETLDGPMRLVITGLAGQSGPVTLANTAGQTPEGQPFLNVPVPEGGLGPGGTVANVLLKFSNPTRGRITFTPAVEAVIRDSTPPGLTAGLANDTGVSGSDNITSDPAIAGSVTELGLLAIKVDNIVGEPVPLTELQFAFDGPRLADIVGAPLQDGPHTIQLQATDAAGNSSPPFIVEFLLDTLPPELGGRLKNDTGRSADDGVTQDPTIAGEVSPSDLDALLVALDTDDPSKFMGVDVDPDGKFELDEAFLKLLTDTGMLGDGPHSLHLRATDPAGNRRDVAIPFTLDTAPPAPPLFDLDSDFDSDPIGDHQTTAAVVALRGTTEPDAAVALLETGATTMADDTGGFSFANTALNVGPNPFTVRATDLAGNQSDFGRTIQRLEGPPPPDGEPPVIAAALTNDTGSNATDGLTVDPTIAGTVTDASAIAAFRAGFDETPLASFFDVFLDLLPDGTFSFPRARLEQIHGAPLADGGHTLHLQAADLHGNTSSVFDVAFTLDTTPPAPPLFDLDPAFDSDPIGDQQTTFAVVTLRGQTAPDMAVALLETGAMATADETGAFAFPGVPLGPGPNPFIVRAVDLAGNQAEATEIIVLFESGDVRAPVIVGSLFNDTGRPPADRVTSDPTIVGTVTDASSIATFFAGFGAMPTFDILADLHAGSFTLDAAHLAALNGGALPDGAYTLRLQATDQHGNSSSILQVPFTLDTAGPTAAADLPATVSTSLTFFEVTFSEAVTGHSSSTHYAIEVVGGPGDGQAIPIAAVTPLSSTAARILLAGPIPVGHLQLTLSQTITDPAGNALAEPRIFDFSAVEIPAAISEFSPRNGEELVNLTRETIVRFSEQIDPVTITEDIFYLIASGDRVPGRIRVSPTERFATFFYDEALPPSTEVRVVVKGDMIRGRDGLALDADTDGTPGGTGMADFRTLPLTRISGTDVFGFVYDSFNRKPDGSNIPIVGATIRVDALPEANVVTDATGFFMLRDMPAPEFFVHVDGTTAINAPPGTMYPSVGKPFHSVPGQTTQLNMMGVPFDIFLPPMALGDVQPLSPTEDTDVGFGPAGKAELVQMFPEIDPALWDLTHVTFPGNSAVDDFGNPATQAVIIPVPPNRIPAPLPSNLTPKLVISIQPMGDATNFDVPAPVTFPNLEGLAPGEKSMIFSFDHDAGRWDAIGSATVSADGRMVVSDPGVGIQAPGWHVPEPITPASPEIDGDEEEDEDCEEVDPIPDIYEIFEGHVGPLQDHLFFDDDGSFRLVFGNQGPGEGECSGALVVELTVSGPSGEFLDGLSSNTFPVLPGPGEEVHVDVGVLDLLTDSAAVDAATENKLFGVKVQIRATRLGGNDDLFSREFYVYRLLDIADDDHTDHLIAFEKTRVSAFNTILQEKPLLLDMPDAVRPTITPIVGGDFQFVDGNIRFAPAGIASLTDTELRNDSFELITPGNNPAGEIQVSGTAVGNQRVLFSESSFTDVVRELVDSNPTVLDTDDFVNLFPADGVDAGALRSDEPGFQAMVEEIYNAVLIGIEGNFGGVNNEAQDALEILDAAMGEGILIDLRNAAFSGPLACPDAASCAAWTDFQKTDFIAFAAGDNATSGPQEKFHFDSITNDSRNDPGPQGSTFSGILFKLDMIAQRVQGTADFENVIVNRLANVLTHEIGHALGAMHLISGVGNYIAGSVMGTDANSNTLSTFGATLEPAVKFALGLPVTEGEFTTLYNYYKDQIGNDPFAFNNSEALPGHDGTLLGLDAPLLAVFDGPVIVGSPVPNRITSVDLGATSADGIGDQVSTFSLFLFSDGDRDLTISDISLVRSSPGFSIDGVDGLPITLAPLDPSDVQPDLSTHLITVRFDPSVTGLAEDILRIESNRLGGKALDIPLRGLGVSPAGDIAFRVRNNNAGGLRLHDAPRTVAAFASVQNNGASPLTVTDIVMSPLGIGQFTVAGLPPGFGPANPMVLNPGETFGFDLTFDANLMGLQQGEIHILSDDPNMPIFRQAVVGTGLPDSSFLLGSGNDFVVIETSSGVPLRTRSSSTGFFEFFLPPNTPYKLTIFDPDSGLVAHREGYNTAGAGIRTSLGTPVFLPSRMPDTDGDGLPDDAEFAIGTSPAKADTDGDGLQDFTEVQQGLDPLGGRAFPTGIIASLPLSGVANEVVVEGSTIDAQQQTAYVATGPTGLPISHGLAIVDVSEFDNPIVLGQVDLPGDSRDVAVDPVRNLAVVAAGPLHLVDVSDPMQPVLRKTINVPGGARRVEVFDGLAYVATFDSVVTIDLATGEVMQTLHFDVGNGELEDIARDGEMLYAFVSGGRPIFGGGAGSLYVIDISREGSAGVVGRLDDIPIGDKNRIVAGSGVVYVGSSGRRAPNGMATIDVSNPNAPTVISGPDFFFAVNGFAVNGSGLALVGGQTAAGPGVSVFDVTDLQDTDAFLFPIPTPGEPLSIAIASGIAFTANGPSGLHVINFLPFDTQGQVPSVSIRLGAGVQDADPDTEGLQLAQGTTVPIIVDVADDVQVRNVELLVNGKLVGNDVSFPWDFSAVALGDNPADTTVTVQVRATDTGGNASLSNVLDLDLVPDRVAPTITQVIPRDGSTGSEGLRRVAVHFSEPVGATTVTPDSIQLVNEAGARIMPLSQELRNDDQLVVLIFDPMPAGSYTLTVDAAVTDRAGNALGVTDVVSRFTLTPRITDLFPDRVYPTGLDPWDIASGDLDRNGTLDFVTANAGSDSVSIFLGSGDGTFAGPTDYATGDFPESVALADLDKDGDLDLVIGDPRSISVFLGNGDGTFAERTDYDVGTRTVAVGDMDGDGNPDIIAIALGGLAVLPGQGDGTFGPRINFAGNIEMEDLLLGDVDRDGDLDVVTGRTRGLTVWRFRGLDFPPELDLHDLISTPTALALGDLDQDGDLDYILSNLGLRSNTPPDILVLVNRGDGRIARLTESPLSSLANELALTDLDGDQDLDLVAIDDVSHKAYALLGNGDGTFGPETVYPAKNHPLGLTVGDFDRDGAPDVAVLNSFGANVSLLFGRGDGTFVTQRDFPVGHATGAFGDSPNAIVLGDLDGDRLLDLVTANRLGGTLSVSRGLGAGAFAESTEYLVGGTPLTVTLGNMNGDGNLDLVGGTTTLSGAVRVWPGRGDGTFGASKAFTTGGLPLAVAMGDLDGDGDSDIVTVGGHNVTVLLFRANGSAATRVDHQVLGASSVALGDLDGDGDLDIVATASSDSHNVSVLLGRGDGTFAAPVEHLTGPFPVSLALGDLDRDGDLDIVTANRGDTAFPFTGAGISFLPGNGDGTFGPRDDRTVGRQPTAVAMGDLDLDGSLDVAVANAEGWSVSILFGGSKGLFTSRRDYGVLAGLDRHASRLGITAVALGDLEGDGDLDFVTANDFSDTVSPRLNRRIQEMGMLPQAAAGPLAQGRASKGTAGAAARQAVASATVGRSAPLAVHFSATSPATIPSGLVRWDGSVGGIQAGVPLSNAEMTQSTWLRPFLLDLAADAAALDPNRTIRVELGVAAAV